MLPESADGPGTLDKALSAAIARAAASMIRGVYREPLNVLHIGLAQGKQVGSGFAAEAQAKLQQYRAQLVAMDIRTVNFFLVKPGANVLYFNYYAETRFAEDPISRNM